jgi:hypothetical protein
MHARVRARLDAHEARASGTQFCFSGADFVRERAVEHLSKKWSATMKRISRVLVLSGFVLGLTSAAAFAGGNIVTRSVEDANADLMRTYQTHGGSPAGNIRVRSEADAYADLMRDWSAKPSTAIGQSVHARAAADAYADMMRIWGPVASVQ